MRRLEGVTDLAQAAAKALFKLALLCGISRIAFAGGGEYVGNFLVTVHVEEHVHAVLFHLLPDEGHLRA